MADGDARGSDHADAGDAAGDDGIIGPSRLWSDGHDRVERLVPAERVGGDDRTPLTMYLAAKVL